MIKRHSTSECFIAAIQAFREGGWFNGQQKELAKRIGYTESHLSQVFQNKREPGHTLQEKIADELDLRVEDIWKVGRMILDGKGFLPFIGKIEHLPANSPDQAKAIVELTNKQFGLDGLLYGYQPRGWEDFLSGKISASGFYKSYSDELVSIVGAVRKKYGAQDKVNKPQANHSNNKDNK